MNKVDSDTIEEYQMRRPPLRSMYRSAAAQRAVNGQFIDIWEDELSHRAGSKQAFGLERPILTEAHDGESLSSLMQSITLGALERSGKQRWLTKKEYSNWDTRESKTLQGVSKSALLQVSLTMSPRDFDLQIKFNNRLLLLELKENLRMAVLLPEPLYLIISEYLLGERELLQLTSIGKVSL